VVKVLTQSGDSLADIYDVEGSIAGIEQLETNELPIVHEMGQTVFSERFSGNIRRLTTGDIAASASFNVFATDLPAGPFRIFGVFVFVDTASRILLASLALRNPDTGREIPLFCWDSGDDIQVRCRLVQDGAAVGTVTSLRQVQSQDALPAMGTGFGQPQRVNELAFRGLAEAFGAGTVECTVLIHIGFSQIRPGLSSRGLPVPSW